MDLRWADSYFSTLLLLHIKGYYTISRYLFFIITINGLIYGSLYHGEYGGFGFMFFATALLTVLFFDNKYQYFSLFVLSVVAFVSIKILYSPVEPTMPLERMIFPYYSNFVITSILIYLGYQLFKFDHLKYEKELKAQRDQIQLSGLQHSSKSNLIQIIVCPSPHKYLLVFKFFRLFSIIKKALPF